MLFKIHYGLWYGGLAGIIPFMLPYAMRYSDTTPVEHGILYTILPFIALVAKPLAGSIADRYAAHRRVMVISISAAVVGYGSLAIYPFFPDLTANHKHIVSVLYYIAALVGNTAMCVTNSIGDSLAVNSSIRKGISYGHYRLWGPVGFGIFGMVWGLANQLTYLPDYTPGIIFMTILLVINMLILANWRDEAEFKVVAEVEGGDIPATSSLSYGTSGAPTTTLADEEAPVDLRVNDESDVKISSSRMAGLVLKMCRKHKSIFAYIFILTFCGIMTAIHWQFFFQYLNEITTGQASKFKTIATWALPIQSIGGELIFFMISSIIIKRLGASIALIICLLSFASRYLLYAYVIPNVNVYWILLVEVLQGPCFGLMYSVLTHQANFYSEKIDELLSESSGNENLKISLHSTLQGVLGSSFEGLGLGIGALIGGLTFSRGPVFMWQLAGFSSLIIASIYTVATFTTTLITFLLRSNTSNQPTTVSTTS